MIKRLKIHNVLKPILDEVDGFLMDAEAVMLYQLAKKVDHPIVEIGSWKGKSTICLAKGSEKGKRVKIFAIDPFTGSSEHGRVWTYDEFKENIVSAGINNLVKPLVMTSSEVVKNWQKPIGLLWIDGAHEYEHVKFDFENWVPFLVEGGIIAMHDTKPGGKAGPYRVILENIVYSNKYNLKFLYFTKLTACFKKVEKVSIFDRLNFLIQFYFRAFIALLHIQILKLIPKWRT